MCERVGDGPVVRVSRRGEKTGDAVRDFHGRGRHRGPDHRAHAHGGRADPATVAIAKKAEEVGLDVFATGEHHNPPFVPSSPTTLLGFIAAQTERIILSTATTLITTNDPVKIAEDFSVLQHLSGGRTDLMLGRGNTGPVYPWFGQDIRPGDPADGRALWAAATAVAGGGRRLGRELPHPAAGLHPRPRARWTVSRRSCGTAPSAPRRSQNSPPSTATGSSLTTSSGRVAHTKNGAVVPRNGSSTTATAPPAQAIVGLGGQVFMRHNSQDAVREFRPYFDNAPVYGHGPSLEEFTAQTPLTVGSPRAGDREDTGLPRIRR